MGKGGTMKSIGAGALGGKKTRVVSSTQAKVAAKSAAGRKVKGYSSGEQV